MYEGEHQTLEGTEEEPYMEHLMEGEHHMIYMEGHHINIHMGMEDGMGK